MAFLTTAISTGKGASDTVTVNDWNVGLADNLLTGVVRAIAEGFTTGSASASIDLTSLSTVFRHLHVEAVLRSAISSQAEATAYIRLNNDAGSNYSNVYSYMYGTSTAYTIAAAMSTTLCYIANVPTCGTTAGRFARTSIDITDYCSTSIYKQISARTGAAASTGSSGLFQYQAECNYFSLTNITRITFETGGGNLSSGCRVTVYGLPYTTSL